MNVNIISSNNNYGLTADMKLITYTLKKKYNKKKFNFVFVEYVQYRCKYAAINIFIEKINYELIKYGSINIFIPNHEFFNKNWIEYLDYMDIVLVKSLYSREVFNSLTDRTKVKYIGWRSTDRYLHNVSKDYSKILHLRCVYQFSVCPRTPCMSSVHGRAHRSIFIFFFFLRTVFYIFFLSETKLSP